ncbi:hypothetical protein BIW11_06914, partial [Tropilaelaps mercedesae]
MQSHMRLIKFIKLGNIYTHIERRSFTALLCFLMAAVAVSSVLLLTSALTSAVHFNISFSPWTVTCNLRLLLFIRSSIMVTKSLVLSSSTTEGRYC